MRAAGLEPQQEYPGALALHVPPLWTPRQSPVQRNPAGGEHLDLEVDPLQQAAQRGDSGRIRGRQVKPVEQFGPGDPEAVDHQHLDPALGQHRVDLGLAVRTQPDQLGPVPHQLTQLPRRRRSDPRLRQAPHPHQIRQVHRVPQVVLHPTVLNGLHPNG